MRVAVVGHGITDQSRLGGPGRVAATHARELARRGLEVSVLTTDLIWKGRRADEPTFRLLDADGITVHCAPAYSIPRWPGSLGPVFSPASRRLLSVALSGADVVHAHEWPQALTQRARRLAHRAGTAVVIQPHGSIQPRTGLRRLIHAGFNALHAAGSEATFIAGSPREADDIRRVVGPGLAIEELVNPMLESERRESEQVVIERRASWGLPADARILLYAHRIAPNKGLDIAIRALAAQPSSDCLVVIGEDTGYPAFADTCRALVRELGLDNRVRFFPAVSGSEVDEIILAADIFLLPARRDTFPMMVLHALACGRPVVVTSTCQSVDCLRGAVVEVEPDPASLSRVIGSLERPDLLRLGNAGRRLIAMRYSPETVAGQLASLYARAIARLGGESA